MVEGKLLPDALGFTGRQHRWFRDPHKGITRLKAQPGRLCFIQRNKPQMWPQAS